MAACLAIRCITPANPRLLKKSLTNSPLIPKDTFKVRNAKKYIRADCTRLNVFRPDGVKLKSRITIDDQ